MSMSPTNDTAGYSHSPGRTAPGRAEGDLLTSQQTIRRPELRRIVPLADTTIYEMEQRGEFPRRFHLTPRCVVWSLSEVETWIRERRAASHANLAPRAPGPDVRLRKTRPVTR
jgi:prophage regulatory protein